MTTLATDQAHTQYQQAKAKLTAALNQKANVDAAIAQARQNEANALTAVQTATADKAAATNALIAALQAELAPAT